MSAITQAANLSDRDQSCADFLIAVDRVAAMAVTQPIANDGEIRGMNQTSAVFAAIAPPKMRRKN